jgi:hypothetical protein
MCLTLIGDKQHFYEGINELTDPVKQILKYKRDWSQDNNLKPYDQVAKMREG